MSASDAATANPDRIDVLRTELAKAVTNVSRIKALCRDEDDHVRIPAEVRGTVWQRLLGVKKAINPMARWDGALDRPDQDVIHAASAETFDHEYLTTSEAQRDIEKLITFYCKTRNVKFVSGLNRIIAPFFAINLPSPDQIYNFFYATLSKFLPNVFAEAPLALQSLFQLFRLLLLYHDPVLCRHLDQYNVRAELYARDWLFSMFAQSINNLDVILSLWDFIFVEGDPFLSSFIAVGLLMQQRSVILKCQSVQDLTQVLTKFTIEDNRTLDELCLQAQTLRECTPKSFRKQMYNVLFRPQQLDPSFYASVHMAFCLSVSASEVFEKNDEGLRLIVLDCRSRQEYESGRVPTASHIDPDLVLDSAAMNKFIASFAALGQGGRTHLCYLGTGDDTKDVFMNKIILECLEQGYAHVSVVHRGYQGCHEALDPPFDGLVDHNASMCLLCKPADAPQEEKKMSRKEKLLAMRAKVKASWHTQKDKMQKKYSELKQKRRDTQDARRRASSASSATSDQPVVLADTLSGLVEDNGVDIPVDVDINGPIPKNTCINVSQWSTDTSITLLPCRKVSKHGNIHPRYLVISSLHVTSLEVHRTQIGLAYVKSHHHITELQRITFKKPNPNMLFFKFKGPASAGGAGTFKVSCYLLQQPKLVTDLLKARMTAYFDQQQAGSASGLPQHPAPEGSASAGKDPPDQDG